MAERIYSVSQVNFYIKDLFQTDPMLRSIVVRGELSNVKYHTSGHIYFTLKDEKGQIAGVMFAGSRSTGLRFRMEEGQRVLVTGQVSVYERDGRYQIYARKIELDGIGRLYEQFEQLKAKLSEEGLFAQERKKPIPRFPERVGIVTAATGAAIHDIMTVAARRDPFVQLILSPAQVQGEGAAASIVRGIRRLAAMQVDVIIVGRGGGSIEDLWAFNEEIVARAIAACPVPVISAVGHETDFTIADFVSDFRAPTPSAAAEIAVPDVRAVLGELETRTDTIGRIFHGKLRLAKQQMRQLELRILHASPSYRLRGSLQRLDEYPERYHRLMQGLIRKNRQELAEREKEIRRQMQQELQENLHHLHVLEAKLAGLDPMKRLAKGYAYVEHADGRPVKGISELHPGDHLAVTFRDGTADTVVGDIRPADELEDGYGRR